MAWIDVAAREAVATRPMMEVEAAGEAVLLYEVAGTVYATHAVCPHHAAWLIQGVVEGDMVDCPRHMGRFHIPTGRQVRGPACPPLRVFPVRIRAGRVEVKIDQTRAPSPF